MSEQKRAEIKDRKEAKEAIATVWVNDAAIQQYADGDAKIIFSEVCFAGSDAIRVPRCAIYVRAFDLAAIARLLSNLPNPTPLTENKDE